MRHLLPRLLAVLLTVAMGAAACDSPTAGGEPKPGEQAQIGFALDLSGLPVATLTVHVTASDITTPLVFNIPVVNGTATGTITVPAGVSRLITVRAFDAQGNVTHEGSATVAQVTPGANMSVAITLVPSPGNVPITIHMGSMVMTVSRVHAAPPGGDRVGDSIRFQAQVTRPDGTPVPGASVRWASTNPAVATVDSGGLVRALVAGSADIVATYSGFGASLTLTFTPRDTEPPPVDDTAPALVGVDITPDAVTLDSATSTAQVTFAVTASDAGGGFHAMALVLVAPDGTTTHGCGTDGPATPGVTTRTCAITLSGSGPGGRWTVRELALSDPAGNGLAFTGAELAAAGFDSGVTVTVPDSGTDTQAPLLASAVFSPDQVNVTGPMTVTLRIQATDNLSGVARVDLAGGHEQSGFAFTSGEGAAQVGPTTWEIQLALTEESPADGWVYLDMVRLTDHAGNVVELGSADLDSRGARARLFVSHGVVLEP